MKSLDKFLILLYLVALTCFYALFIVLPFGYISSETSSQVLNQIFGVYKWYYFVGALLLILLNIYLTAALFKDGRNERFGIVKSTTDGEINISNDTIKSLVLKTAGQTKGIKDIKVMIKPGKNNINILLKAYIIPDLNIPATVKEVQENVKRYIETIAEVPVGEVKVVVQGVAPGTRLRLE